MLRHKYAWTAAAIMSVAVWGLPLTSSAAPATTPVHAKFVVNGTEVGTGTVISYGGRAFVSAATVKTMTGVKLSWDPATATLSRGTAAVRGKGGTHTYLEELPNQPYYTSSAAICWEHAKDDQPTTMLGRVGYGDYCRLSLPRRPPMVGQHYAHNITVLASADGKRVADAHNTVTLDYDLGGKYRRLSGVAGLVDSPFNRGAVELRIDGDGRTLGNAVIPQGSLPAPFKVDVVGVRQLSIVVANLSGAAPNWDMLPAQYSPGAVMIANPVLSS